MVITKGKRLDDDPVTVQLLSGSNVEFQSFSKMKVQRRASVVPCNTCWCCFLASDTCP